MGWVKIKRYVESTKIFVGVLLKSETRRKILLEKPQQSWKNDLQIYWTVKINDYKQMIINTIKYYNFGANLARNHR